jgi:hypothetical protein
MNQIFETFRQLPFAPSGCPQMKALPCDKVHFPLGAQTSPTQTTFPLASGQQISLIRQVKKIGRGTYRGL